MEHLLLQVLREHAVTATGAGVYRFSDSLPYLLTRLGARMGDLFARELRTEGLTLATYRVLAALTERPDQRLGELAAMTSAELSTLSRLVGAMQRDGLLTRSRPDGDQRSVRIRLTRLGAAAAQRWIPRAIEYERIAVGALAATDLAALKARLQGIYANLAALEAPEPDADGRAKAADTPAGR